MPVQWNGEQVKLHIATAAIVAVNETTQAAADEARNAHWWRNETGQLQQETINEPARPVPGGVSGRFGTTRRRGFYGLFLEIKRPFLRPVADRVFPTLQERLQRRYNA